MGSFDFGELHPAIIHFPIALIVIAFVFDLLYAFTKNEFYQRFAGWFIVFAAIMLVPTAITGLLAKEFYPAGDPDVTNHQNMAIVTVLYTVGYAIFRGYALFNRRIYSIFLFLLLSLINVGLVSTTAEFGGIVVRGRGIMFNSSRPTGTQLPYSHVEKGK